MTRDGASALEYTSLTNIGRSVSAIARKHEDETQSLLVSVLVEHLAARSGEVSVRAAVSRAGQVLFAPVFSARPGETTRLELQIDESVAVLEIRVRLG